MATITTAGSGNWDAGATWTGGSVPADGDTASIESGHTCTLTENEQVGAVVINGGTIAGGGFKITCVKTSGRLFDHSGTITGNLDVELQGTHSTTEDFHSSGNINHLILNGSGLNVDIGRDTTLGNLTITQGTLNTNSTHNHALTVTGNTVVDGTLTGNNSTFLFGTDGVHGSTEGGCLLVNSSGTFTFGSGDVTIFSGFTAKGTEGSPNVTSTGGGDIIIKGRTSNGFMNSHNHHGTNITGDYIIDFDSSAIFDNRGGCTIDCGTYIIKHDGRTYEPWNNAAQATFKIIGNMDIQAGTFDTEYSGQDSQHLTVTGVTTIGDGTGGTPDEATLTCNASTCSFGSGVTADYGILVKANGTFAGGTGTHTAGGFYMDQNVAAKATMTTGVMTINSEKTSANKAWRVEYGGDTFDNANGTVKFHLNGFDTRMSMRGASHANNAFHNLIIEGDTSARQLSPDNGTKIIVDNDLTITNGKLIMGMSHALEVGGDVEIDDASGTAILEMGSSSNISSQAATFGTLTIGGSGTYKATSGTTTITGPYIGDHFLYQNAGTFTHNNGTVKLSYTSYANLTSGGDAFYNLISDVNHGAYVGIQIMDALEVMNNLTINENDGFTCANGAVTVHGNVFCNGNWSRYNTSSQTQTIKGTLTIGSSGWYRPSSGTNNLGGIRNLGGSVN